MRTRLSIRASLAVIAVAAGITAHGCSGAPTTPAPAGPPPELTSLPRPLTATEVSVRDAANQFSLALWREVNRAQVAQSVFISPLSASFALGMALNGASGATYSEMRDALQLQGITLPEVNDGYRSLMELLVSLDTSVQVQVANSVWYKQSMPFRQTFFDTTAKYFDASSRALDFNDAPTSLAEINGWVSNATNSRITKVLDDIDPHLIMFLVNAIYFKGDWREAFDPAETVAGTFHGSHGNSTIPFMTRTGVKQMQGATFRAIELPYGNGAFVMNVLLPNAGIDIESFSLELPVAALESANYVRLNAMLRLPKLRLEYERTLNDDLKALGMKVPFDQQAAEFMAMSDLGDDLYLDFVKQNTFVEIDEKGTEAAAVTTVGIGLVSAPEPFVVDRPFVFVIRERLSGTIMFMGKITDIP